MTKYKLVYFNIRVLGEPIRYMLYYMNKEFEDYRMPREDWVQLKEKVPFGKLPLLEIDGKVFHQSTAILRYLAIEAGLAGNNACENFQIDMIVAAFGDFVAEVSRFFKMENPTDKENLRLSIIKNSVPFYMTRLENVLKKNGGYLANGKLSWAEFYIVGYCTSLPGLIGIDLTEKYPFFKELTDRIHSLPRIKEWVKRRPNTPM
nr:glutathione S-transferase-like [Halyomorpha halys]